MTEGKKLSFKELIHGDQPVLVDFYADWCGPCKMMAPILEDFTQSMAGKVKVLKVDVDRNPVAATNYAVQGVPTLMLFRQGKILWRQSGVVPSHQLKNIISRLMEN
jgi:thioredoxin 1